MDGIKNVLASKTICGAAIAVLAAMAGLFHLNFGAADQAQLLDAIDQIFTAIGGLIAIWGCVTATKRIG